VIGQARWLSVALLGFVWLLLSAAEKKERRPPPWEKPVQVGRYLFLENCSVCHEINKPKGKKLGPSLFRFFQNEKTPLTGFPPTEDFMISKVKVGGVFMPAFRDVLSDDEIAKIIAFIRTKH
jgi:mono/diheme cytochrome c family protein